MSLTEDIDLKDLVRTIPNYPKPGIMFRDITTLLGHANGLRACIERLVAPFTNRRIESVAGIEARGFILGGAVADRLRCGSCRSARRASCRPRPLARNMSLSTASTLSKSMRMR